MREHIDLLPLLSNKFDIWDPTSTPKLQQLRDLYLNQYSALPTYTQFMERGVNELDYVSLGRFNETNMSVLVMSRGKVLKGALKRGKDAIQPAAPNPKKAKQLQGKRKCKAMMNEVFKKHDKLKNVWGKIILQERESNRSLTS